MRNAWQSAQGRALRQNNGWIRMYRGQNAMKRALMCGNAKCTHFVLCACKAEQESDPLQNRGPAVQ